MYVHALLLFSSQRKEATWDMQAGKRLKTASHQYIDVISIQALLAMNTRHMRSVRGNRTSPLCSIASSFV